MFGTRSCCAINHTDVQTVNNDPLAQVNVPHRRDPPRNEAEPRTGKCFPGVSRSGLPLVGLGLNSSFLWGNFWACGLYAAVTERTQDLSSLLPHTVPKEIVIKIARKAHKDELLSALDDWMSLRMPRFLHGYEATEKKSAAEVMNKVKHTFLEGMKSQLFPDELTALHQIHFVSLTDGMGHAGLLVELAEGTGTGRSTPGELPSTLFAPSIARYESLPGPALSEWFADIFLGVKGTPISSELIKSIQANLHTRIAAAGNGPGTYRFVSGTAIPCDDDESTMAVEVRFSGANWSRCSKREHKAAEAKTKDTENDSKLAAKAKSVWVL